jgi:hypothetical protein
VLQKSTSQTALKKPPIQAENSSLGIIAKIASQPKPSGRNRRYKLQDYAAKLLPNHRVAQCQRTIAPGQLGASIMHVPGTETSYTRGCIVCNRLWECPVCAEKITNHRREEISEAIASARRAGWSPVLITATLRHHKSDTCNDVLDALLKAWRGFTGGKGFQELREQWYWEGSIKSLEPTYGINGWHPHLHLLVFLSGDIKNFNIGGFKDMVADRWLQVLKRQGKDASYEHGIDVRTADADIAEYVAKFGREPKDAGWTASRELTKSGSKRGRADGLTPFQLLEIYGKGDDSEEFLQAAGVVGSAKHAGALFSEYVAAFSRRNQLVWSRGLRAALALAPELSDSQVVEQEPAEAVELALILTPSWKKIVAAGKRGELLDVAASGDAIQVRAWLWANFRIMHFSLEDY